MKEDELVYNAIFESRLTPPSLSLSRVYDRFIDALAKAENGHDLRCIEAHRVGGYMTGTFVIPGYVSTGHHNGRECVVFANVPIVVRIGFPRVESPMLMGATLGSKVFSKDQLGAVFPRVAEWSPKVPRYWYALALLRENPPPGKCGVCLSSTYEDCPYCRRAATESDQNPK